MIFRNCFCCKKGDFSIQVVGVPLHHSKLRKGDLHPILDKIIKTIAGWKGR
jgi:hypothetical protein